MLSDKQMLNFDAGEIIDRLCKIAGKEAITGAKFRVWKNGKEYEFHISLVKDDAAIDVQ